MLLDLVKFKVVVLVPMKEETERVRVNGQDEMAPAHRAKIRLPGVVGVVDLNLGDAITNAAANQTPTARTSSRLDLGLGFSPKSCPGDLLVKGD
jgi:hypothetical protein